MKQNMITEQDKEKLARFTITWKLEKIHTKNDQITFIHLTNRKSPH